MNMIKVKKIKTVPGLYYIPDILSHYPDLKSDGIIGELDKNKWEQVSANENSRVVQMYGYKYNYNTNNIKEPTQPFIPCITRLKDILEEIVMEIIPNANPFNQCIVNNYTTGQGISKHIDNPLYGNTIGCYTIGDMYSGATFKFRKDDIVKTIYIEPNSLYIMSGDARYVFTHEMVKAKKDKVKDNMIHRDRRISITFRNVTI